MLNNKGQRELAYVVAIDEIRPIEGYDRVEHARVGGWWVIVSKNDNLAAGDKCIYFEVDSKCPASDERFAFLEKRNYKIKTLKMCKVFSQGLLMPLALFPEFKDAEVGTFVTDALGVKYAVDEDNERKAAKVNKDKKYQSMAARHAKLFKKKPIRWLMRREWSRKILFIIFGKKRDNPRGWPVGKFPGVSKTDEERVENMPWILGYENPLIVTEKLDGTSTTFILERKGKNKFEFYVCSRNVRQADEKQECYHDHNIYWDMAFKYNVENKLREYLVNNPELTYVCIQGESVGSVQGNPLKLDNDDFYAFNFITSATGRMSSVEGRDIVKKMGMKWVPILSTDFMMPTDMEEFKRMATALSVVNPAAMREGIVLRDPTTDLSFKNVSREYLMKHNG